MKKTMRIWALLLAMVLLMMCLAGCGKKDTEEPLQDPTATPAPTPTATPVPTPTPDSTIYENGFAFDPMHEIMFTTANLNVRDLPNTDGQKIGMFHKGAEVEITGQCRETDWYRVDYGGQIGYVSNEYVE